MWRSKFKRRKYPIRNVECFRCGKVGQFNVHHKIKKTKGWNKENTVNKMSSKESDKITRKTFVNVKIVNRRGKNAVRRWKWQTKSVSIIGEPNVSKWTKVAYRVSGERLYSVGEFI